VINLKQNQCSLSVLFSQWPSADGVNRALSDFSSPQVEGYPMTRSRLALHVQLFTRIGCHFLGTIAVVLRFVDEARSPFGRARFHNYLS
jgi:hypothetical protein